MSARILARTILLNVDIKYWLSLDQVMAIPQ